ncbi:MAG: hypothetical protein PVI37_06685 [Gammaproteobacteria bacterium]|jgi:hypothetical protein
MHRWLFLILAGWLVAAPVLAADHVITAEDWSRPRSGKALLAMKPVKAAVQEWRGEKDAHIVILYAGGDAGNLWALEVRDWLVALGIPSKDLDVRAGGPSDDRIVLSVES